MGDILQQLNTNQLAIGDIKPENLLLNNGNLILIDTDTASQFDEIMEEGAKSRGTKSIYTQIQF